jgi:hypothetical protein
MSTIDGLLADGSRRIKLSRKGRGDYRGNIHESPREVCSEARKANLATFFSFSLLLFYSFALFTFLPCA